jgi:hypothetical protein
VVPKETRLNSRNLLILAFGVTSVVSYVAYDYFAEVKQDEKKQEASRIVPFSKEDFEEIKFLDPLKVGFKLFKKDGAWHVDRPIAEKAYEPFIDSFLTEIANEKTAGVAKEGAEIDWKVFGLDPVKGYIEITAKGQSPLQIAVSDKKNFEGMSFIRINSEPKVFLAGSTWAQYIERDAKSFRDNRLMRTDISEVLSIKQIKPSAGWEIKLEASKWVSVQKPEWDLDQKKVRNILSKLNSIEAVDFVVNQKPTAEDFKNLKAGAKEVSLEVSLKSEDKTAKLWKADFYRGDSEFSFVHVSDPQLVLKISSADMDEFVVPEISDYRDRRKPFEFDATKAQKILVKDSLRETVIIKDEKGKWKTETVLAGFDFNEDVASKLISSLRDLEAVDLQATGYTDKLKSPDLDLSVHDKDGKILLKLVLAKVKRTRLLTMMTEQTKQKDGVENTKVKKLQKAPKEVVEYIGTSSLFKEPVAISENLYNGLQVQNLWKPQQPQEGKKTDDQKN